MVLDGQMNRYGANSSLKVPKAERVFCTVFFFVCQGTFPVGVCISVLSLVTLTVAVSLRDGNLKSFP